MQKEQYLLFPSFRLDPVNEQLWRGSQEIFLRPITFTVLRYLVEHPGRLISKENLLEAVWQGTHVCDAALRGCVQEIRKALGDDPAAPEFIETVPRRGYRFIGKITELEEPGRLLDRPLPFRAQMLRARGFLDRPTVSRPIGVAGREAELGQLQRWLEKALRGERQVGFIAGEPGIGKTTVVEAFLERAASGGDLWIGYGQCLEHYGAGEAYMPVLEALGRLCRGPGGKRIIGLLDQYAPTWLAQMPSLLSTKELNALQRKIRGASRKRMLRELAEAVEALTADRLLVLVLEDLHWGDYSTLDLVSVLAQRREPARLLLLGTYRPVEMQASGHPLKVIKQGLQLHGQCQELPLGFLTEAAVAEYLAVRFAGSELPAGLARLVHRRTDGNPLFMVNVVNYMVAQGLIVQVEGRWVPQVEVEKVGVPENLRQMIEKQIEGLSLEEQLVLEAASVAGAQFSAAAVAAGLGREIEEVEEVCSGLARHGQLLRLEGSGEWPDGTAAARYSFIHELYQGVLYEGATVKRRAQLHRRIGEREEAAYGNRVGEIAGELAVHFEAGQDYWRAVRYLGQAAENVLRRYANREAISYLTKGLELLKILPDTPERVQQELILQTTFGPALIAIKGYTTAEVGKTYARALQLCQQISNPLQLFLVLRELWVFHYARAELRRARELGEQLLTLAQREQDPALFLEAHYALAATLSCTGEISSAREHAEQSIVLYDARQHRSHAFLYGQDPGVFCRSWTAIDLWFLGYPDQALKRSHDVLTLARDVSHPFSLTTALFAAAILYQFRREVQATQERIEAMVALASEQGFAFWSAWGPILRGWVLTVRGQGKEGIAQMRQGTAALRSMEAGWFRPYHLALLAEAHGKMGQTEEGLSVLAEALAEVDGTGQHFYDAELYRLKGELLLAQEGKNQKAKGKKGNVSEAEKCFQKAIDVACRQGAKSLELRAVMSLSRLLQRQGKKEEAQQLLAEVYGWFTEGFDTADLKEAKALLNELAGHPAS